MRKAIYRLLTKKIGIFGRINEIRRMLKECDEMYEHKELTKMIEEINVMVNYYKNELIRINIEKTRDILAKNILESGFNSNK